MVNNKTSSPSLVQTLFPPSHSQQLIKARLWVSPIVRGPKSGFRVGIQAALVPGNVRLAHESSVHNKPQKTLQGFLYLPFLPAEGDTSSPATKTVLQVALIFQYSLPPPCTWSFLSSSQHEYNDCARTEASIWPYNFVLKRSVILDQLCVYSVFTNTWIYYIYVIHDGFKRQ